MPELPEVETTRRSLEPVILGRTITDVEVTRARMVRRQHRPQDFVERLPGRVVTALDRHGKFLLTRLSGDITWVTHLGMSGRVRLAPADEELAPHTNIIVRFDRGPEFRLIDPRTFGFVVALTPEELAESSIGQMGPDAYSGLPNRRALVQALSGRTAPIKALLLDQRVIAGVGNIYADEALHRAAISPHRQGGSLTPAEIGKLRIAIKATLAAGLKHGGTSLDDLAYLLPDGRAGEYTARLRAYGREDEPCGRCRRPIKRDVIRQRSSFWCPGCQG
jgi:formamidopyrimidine-DNA glycosylase